VSQFKLLSLQNAANLTCFSALPIANRVVASCRLAQIRQNSNCLKASNGRSKRLVPRGPLSLIFSISFEEMDEFSTPPRVRCRKVTDKAELNTPIKIPASPFLQQIGYGTGMYIPHKCLCHICSSIVQIAVKEYLK